MALYHYAFWVVWGKRQVTYELGAETDALPYMLQLDRTHSVGLIPHISIQDTVEHNLFRCTGSNPNWWAAISTNHPSCSEGSSQQVSSWPNVPWSKCDSPVISLSESNLCTACVPEVHVSICTVVNVNDDWMGGHNMGKILWFCSELCSEFPYSSTHRILWNYAPGSIISQTLYCPAKNKLK